MLKEAVEIIRMLWQGETTSWWGDYYTVEDARIYTLPEELPKIMVAGSGPISITAAGEIGDGFIGLAPEKEQIERFEEAGGQGKPRYGQITVCWAESEKAGRETVHKIWPNSGLTGELSQELRTVVHFEQAAKMVQEADVAKEIICGPDPQKHIEGIQAFIDAGYDHVYVHQIGPDQEGFFRFYGEEVLPHFAK
jgi:G6PDH family F420-dependent oxidoreductase